MADKDFRIDLILGAKFAEAFRALDDAKRKIGDVDKAAGKFGATAGASVGGALRATAAAGVAAATAATAVMGLYIAKTIEAEKVQAQLQARIKDTGGVAGRTLEQLNETAARLQGVTVFDDEAIGNVQAMLLTFKEIRGLQFDRATASVLDLSTAMGTDLNSAALQLGKALNDPIGGLTALSRAGVQFSDDQKKVIEKLVETGQVAKAQELILAELESQMGSAAEAARDTLGGSIQALQNAFDNLLEGDSGDAGITGTRAAVESLIKLLNDPTTKQGFDSLIGGLTRAATAAVNAAAEVANFTRFVAEEVASRVGGPAGDDIIRIEQAIERQQRLVDMLDQKGTGAERRNNSGYATQQRAELARLQKMLADATQSADQQTTDQYLKYRGLPPDFGLNFNPNPSKSPPATGGGTPKKSGGTKADPDADIKRRIASLNEEVALLGQIEDGEDRASEAAKARYDITEGEFKNKSPQLKAELVAAAEALDAKNKDIEAEKKRQEAIKESQEAYAELMRDLRTPAQVAVDDAIAKLNTLTEAMQRGEAGPGGIDAAQQKIIDGAFTRAPETGFGDYSPMDQFEQQRIELETWYSTQLSMLATFRQQRADLSAQWDAQEQQIEAQHQAAMQQLQAAQSQVMLGAASSMFGSLAEIARAGVGEQSKAYRVLFAISKGFAVAQAAVALAQNVAEASKVGFPQNLPLIAAAFAQGAQIAALIAGANYSGGSGYAAGGYTGPGGKYEPAGIVHKGEGVLTQEEIAKLGGPSGFYELRALIHEGELLDRQRAMAGYAMGGLVGDAGPVLSSPDYASYPQGGAALNANIQNDMTLYLLNDRDQLVEALAKHPDMRKAIVIEVTENGQAIRAGWGSGG